MAALVPFARPEPKTSLITVGAPLLSADTWSQLAGLANWIKGWGACVVPAYNPNHTISTGNTDAFQFRITPRTAAIQRVWVLTLRTTATVSVTADIRAPASSGSTLSVLVPRNSETIGQIVYVQNLAAKSSTEAQIDIDIKANSGAVIVEGIMAYDMPRPVLTQDTTDYGVDITTVRPRSPIWEVANTSAEGIFNALANADPRRVGLVHWSVPTAAALTRTSATPLSIFDLAQPVQTVKRSTATTQKVKWSAYAKVAAGTGTVTLSTGGSAVSDSASVTGTSYGWTSAREVSIYVDDFGQADGLQGGGWDELQIAIAGDGVNQLSLAAVSVWLEDVTP